MMGDQGGGGGSGIRDYRKGNWTVSETMVLIEAKRMDEERRTKRNGNGSKPAELRWKWVEDYCWRKGCFRSQNQCNDKWDNLMRDYKKVRDYQRRLFAPAAAAAEAAAATSSSYWKLEKNDRKERNLPSNMLLQIYDALVDVVERRGGASHSRLLTSPAATSDVMMMMDRSTNLVHPPKQVLPLTQIPVLPLPQPPRPPQPVPLPPHSQSPPPPPPPLTYSPHHQSPTVGSDNDGSSSSDSDDDGTSQSDSDSDSPANKRMRTSLTGGGEGTSGGATTTAAREDDEAVVGRAISRIAEAIEAGEEREERRHREMVSLQERRIKVEESKAEITRHGIKGLADAINKLANSILALASSPSPSHNNNNINKSHNPSSSSPAPN